MKTDKDIFYKSLKVCIYIHIYTDVKTKQGSYSGAVSAHVFVSVLLK